MTRQANALLTRFREDLGRAYGDRLERVVLYGSHARGDATKDSDYDIAVFIHDLKDCVAESDKVALAAFELLSETGSVIHAMTFPAGAYRERTLFMHELRRERIDL